MLLLKDFALALICTNHVARVMRILYMIVGFIKYRTFYHHQPRIDYMKSTLTLVQYLSMSAYRGVHHTFSAACVRISNQCCEDRSQHEDDEHQPRVSSRMVSKRVTLVDIVVKKSMCHGFAMLTALFAGVMLASSPLLLMSPESKILATVLY